MRKAPNIALAVAFAGAMGCASPQMEAKSSESKDTSAECDRKEVRTISSEPGRLVFNICGITYVAETRDAAKSTVEGDEKEANVPTKPDVLVKWCNPMDLSNMRLVSKTKNKTVHQICDMIHTAEIQSLQMRSSVSGPVIRARVQPAGPVSAPVPPKKPDPSEEEDKE